MVTGQHDRGVYRYTPHQIMTEDEFREKLEKLVNLIAGVCIPDEIKQAKAVANRRWRGGASNNR